MRKTKLTELTVRSLKPAAAAYVVWDDRQHGLAIRVQPTGSKSWYVVYSLRNRVRWYHLGNANAIGLAAPASSPPRCSTSSAVRIRRPSARPSVAPARLPNWLSAT